MIKASLARFVFVQCTTSLHLVIHKTKRTTPTDTGEPSVCWVNVALKYMDHCLMLVSCLYFWQSDIISFNPTSFLRLLLLLCSSNSWGPDRCQRDNTWLLGEYGWGSRTLGVANRWSTCSKYRVQEWSQRCSTMQTTISPFWRLFEAVINVMVIH